jgi:hypothetical protein
MVIIEIANKGMKKLLKEKSKVKSNSHRRA